MIDTENRPPVGAQEKELIRLNASTAAMSPTLTADACPYREGDEPRRGIWCRAFDRSRERLGK